MWVPGAHWILDWKCVIFVSEIRSKHKNFVVNIAHIRISEALEFRAMPRYVFYDKKNICLALQQHEHEMINQLLPFQNPYYSNNHDIHTNIPSANNIIITECLHIL